MAHEATAKQFLFRLPEGLIERVERCTEDLQATGCYGAPTNDIHYRAATEASLPASVAKDRVVATWAGVASRYGLPSWTAGQL